MAGMVEYLQWRGDIPPGIAPFNDVDWLILARLVYLPFEDIVAFDTSVGLVDAVEALLNTPQRIVRPEDFALLSQLVRSVRFAPMRLLRYVSHWDAVQEKQFAALTVDVGDTLRCVLFRGTDNTLVGWKEDLNMTFMTRIPSQLEAAAYLDGAYTPDRRFIVAGHSKGGNLAVYAAAFANPVVQDQIDKIYSFDGPGFHKEILISAGYGRINSRICAFVPQTSVIGMLLDHEADYTIVHSTQSGLMQHDMYSWQTLPDGFVCLDTVTGASRFIDRTLHDWLLSVEPAQRAAFVDAMFQVLENVQGDSVQSVLSNKYKSLHAVVRAVRGMDPQMRKPLMRALGALLKCVQNNARLVLTGTRTQQASGTDMERGA